MIIVYRYNQGWPPNRLTTYGVMTSAQFYDGAIFTDSCFTWTIETLGM